MFGMDRHMDGPLPVTSSPLPVHLGTIGGHMRHHSYSLPKKMNFPKSADGHTDIRTEKKVTPKDPLGINARDLKKTATSITSYNVPRPPPLPFKRRYVHIFSSYL